MTTLTRDELLSRKREQRLHNLALYQQSLEDKKREAEQEAELEKIKNRFFKKAYDKRKLNHSKIEQVLGMTLKRHSEIINKRIEKIKEEERQRSLEIDEALQRKRNKRLANLKPKRQRFPKRDNLELRNVIQEKVNSWRDDFLKFAGDRKGAEFYAYSKSEEGANEFQKLLQKYNRRISIISRKNEYVAELRKEIFETYLINLV
jgi:hypothetical protein